MKFNELFDLYFPEKTVKFNKNIHSLEPYITSGILVSRKNKFKLERKSIVSPTDINKQLYKDYKNKYNTVIRSAKKSTMKRPWKKTKGT